MKKTVPFHDIPSVLSDIRLGKMVVVVDDEDRENEGDLVMAAEKVTPDAINFMAKHGRGLICVPTVGERLKQLGIEQMVVQNRDVYKTDFQVSVDAAKGISTGISAADRARTIKSWWTQRPRPRISFNRGTSSPCDLRPEGSCAEPDIQKRPLIWPLCQACALPG